MRGLTVFLLAVLALSKEAAAACSCGFRDPTTGSLWTDAIITYFNETDAAQSIVFNPERSADRYGHDDAGLSGDGQQPWVASQRTNVWEDDFGSTWVSAVSFNNSYFANDSSTKGLSMQVSPADTDKRISYGSQLVSRRRDILFGSFRTFVKPSTPASAGTVFDMEVAYNQSELIRSAIYSSDGWGDSTLQYSASAREMDARPQIFNFSRLDATLFNVSARTYDFRQYRMDWLPRSLVFSNDGTNGTSNFYEMLKGVDGINLPSVGAPWSFKHWSNGSPTQSQGPPIYHEAVANILWTRLFFNSSFTSRQAEFESQCALSEDKQECSTEDYTLREVTPFDLLATQPNEPPQWHWHAPIWATIVNAAAGGIFLLLLIHALVKRYLKAQRQKREFYAKNPQPETAEPEHAHANQLTMTSEDSYNYSKALGHLDDAADVWDNPALILDDGFSDSDDDTVYSKYEFDDPLRQSGMEKKQVLLGLGGEPIDYVPPVLQMSIRRPKGSASSSSLELLRRNSSLAQEQRPDLLSPPSYRRLSRPGPFPIQGFSEDQPDKNYTSFAPYRHTVRRRADSHLTQNSEAGIPSDGLGEPPTFPYLGPQFRFEDGTTAPFTWSTRIAEWKPAGKNEHTQELGQLAEPPKAVIQQTMTAAAQPSNVGFFPRFFSRVRATLFVGEGSAKATASGAARIDYLDGLRGFACLLVALHHWLLINYYAITTPGAPAHYRWEMTVTKVLGAVIANGGLNVGLFFTLAARVIANRYLVKGNLQDLAQQIHTRVPRLGVTVSGAILLNYFLIEVDAYHWIRRLASRSWSVWSFYQNYNLAGAGEFLNDYMALWFMQPPMISPLTTHYATGILWTMPVIIQYSWSVYLCALIAREIKSPRKRYPFYVCCIVLSWWANRYEFFFLGGLMLADLDNRLKYRQLSAKGIRIFGKVRLTGAWAAWILFGLGATLAWLYTNSVTDPYQQEYNIHPNFFTGMLNRHERTPQDYWIPSVVDFVWVISFFLLCDLSPAVRTLFQLKFWNVFGRNAFSLYLLHGVVFWSAGSATTLKLLASGAPYWAASLVSLAVSLVLIFVCCELFTRTFDRWGITISRAFWRATSGGLGQRI